MRKEGHRIHEASEHNMENKAFHRMGKSYLHAKPNHLGDKLALHEGVEGHMTGHVGPHFNDHAYESKMEHEGHMVHSHMMHEKHRDGHHPMGHVRHEKHRPSHVHHAMKHRSVY